MLSDEIRRRLEKLNRDALGTATPQPPPADNTLAGPHFDTERATKHTDDVHGEHLSGQFDLANLHLARKAASAPPPSSLDIGEEVTNASGTFLRIRRPVVKIWPAVEQVLGNAGRVLHPPEHADLAALARHFPQRTLLLDLETCGLAGSMIFLVGILWKTDGQLVLDQLLARRYDEERAILDATWQAADTSRVLVTFNGKSFDWPCVHDRSTRHRLRWNRHAATASTGRPNETADRPTNAPAASANHQSEEIISPEIPRPKLAHCDLLHHARRRWKHRLPNCKLQTLERVICKRSRHGDIPGREIPDAYHDFVRTGHPRELTAILHHNALDLITLAQLSAVMLRLR